MLNQGLRAACTLLGALQLLPTFANCVLLWTIRASRAVDYSIMLVKASIVGMCETLEFVGSPALLINYLASIRGNAILGISGKGQVPTFVLNESLRLDSLSASTAYMRLFNRSFGHYSKVRCRQAETVYWRAEWPQARFLSTSCSPAGT